MHPYHSARELTRAEEATMKKETSTEIEDDLRPAYDLRTLLKGSVLGKYADRYREGTNPLPKPILAACLNLNQKPETKNPKPISWAAGFISWSVNPNSRSGSRNSALSS